MNRIRTASISGAPMESQQHRSGRSLNGGDNSLDLLSRNRSSLLISSAMEFNGRSEQHNRSEGMPVGSAKILRSGMDDLLDADIGKHDYDWLLTPPGTPRYPSMDACEQKVPATVPRRSSTVRSVSTARASRLSASQSDGGHSTRPVRSSSVTRPSISNTYSSSYLSNNNRTSILNTSSASITSKPSSPSNRSTSLSTGRPSPTSAPVRPRQSTPAKTRPSTSSAGDKTRPLSNSRPSTPTARPHIPANLSSNISSSAARSTSRPSTPTRRAPAPAPSPTTGRSPSVGRVPARPSSRPSTPSAPASRPSSPGPRAQASVRPVNFPDFSLDAPPNLRTKLPDRPASAGRTRPGMALSVRTNSNTETPTPACSNRRQSLPVISRSKFPENSPKGRLHSNNGHNANESQKSVPSEAAVRRPSKPATATESTGFGMTISKKSIDMALRHMDIRQSMGGIRGASLFPQSIRSATSKGRPARISDPVVPAVREDLVVENGSCNGTVSVSGDSVEAVSKNGGIIPEALATRLNELDLYGSTRYEVMLLREDSKNMNWLHSAEDKADQSPVFDHRFEPLPEPFGLI